MIRCGERRGRSAGGQLHPMFRPWRQSTPKDGRYPVPFRLRPRVPARHRLERRWQDGALASDEHRETPVQFFYENRIAEGLDDVAVFNAVLRGTRRRSGAHSLQSTNLRHRQHRRDPLSEAPAPCAGSRASREVPPISSARSTNPTPEVVGASATSDNHPGRIRPWPMLSRSFRRTTIPQPRPTCRVSWFALL